MQRTAKLKTLAALALLFFSCAIAHADSAMVRYEVNSDFETAKENLELAITNQGLVITSESHINEMLERTGQDLGLGGPVYEDAVAFEFCSAKYSRIMMAADPHNIVFCPFVISVYQIAGDQDTVYIAFRRPQNAEGSEEAQAALQQVVDFLDSIAATASEGWG